MRKLLLLVVIVGALGGAEVASKAYAESKVETTIEARTPGQQDPSVTIDSFPFLGRLLFSGTLGDVRMRANAVAVGPITLDNVELELEGVRVDRDLLLQQEVKLREIDAGVVYVHLERALPVVVEGRVPIPQTDLIPCDVEITGTPDGSVLSCRFTRVPQLFVEASGLLE